MTPPIHPEQSPLPATSVEVAVVEAEPRDLKARIYFVLGRAAHWTPVFVVLILFALVSFKGLRPALSEAGRLAEAEEVLTARHARALAKNREIQMQLVARQDPVFRERQHRLRTILPTKPAVSASATVATEK
ncbi:MAG: hypothetical protein SGI72_05125 [Planctomycetota bacterium]|nr:hypothetical protein [Planctomycetota bacterium]